MPMATILQTAALPIPLTDAYLFSSGTPSRTQTYNPQFRKLLHYSVVLWRHFSLFHTYIIYEFYEKVNFYLVPAAGFEPAPLQGLNLMSLPFGRRRHKMPFLVLRFV